jgi:hypothetical protein
MRSSLIVSLALMWPIPLPTTIGAAITEPSPPHHCDEGFLCRFDNTLGTVPSIPYSCLQATVLAEAIH